MKKANNTTIISTILVVLGVMWVIYFVNVLTDGWVNHLLSVKPREIMGLFGIITFSFAHLDLGHIIANSIPFVILSLLVAFSGGLSMLLPVWVIGALGSGIGIWLLGSSAHVVGASGMVFALCGFLLARSYYSPELINIAVALTTLFLYSGVLFSLFNFTATGISWMGHISGFVAGIFAAFLLSSNKEKY